MLMIEIQYIFILYVAKKQAFGHQFTIVVSVTDGNNIIRLHNGKCVCV